MTSQTASGITDGQMFEIRKQVEVVVNRCLDRRGAQMVIEQGGVFQSRLDDLFRELSGATQNPYKKERVGRICGYPAGWTVPSFDEQRESTASLFPNLVLPEIANRDIVVPSGWDGVWWFPPKIAALGCIFSIQDFYGEGYGQVVEHLIALIGQQRPLYNYHKGKLGANYIRIQELVRGRIQTLEAATDGDFLPPMPITFGQFYGGFSPRNARETAIRQQELPFCTVQVGSLLSVMPERLVAYGDLWIDIPGDEYDRTADGHWTRSLYFCFRGGMPEFGTCPACSANCESGSVVGFPRVLKLVA